jgi:FtsZ-interacting cell division protein ZipA
MVSFTGWRPTRSGIIFVIVAIVLAIIVFAGAWFVQQRGEQVRQQEAAEIAQQNLEEDSDTPIIAEEEAVVEEEAVSEEAAESDNPQVAATEPEQLPTTGPNDLVALLAVTGLAFAGSFYIVSRRAARQL